CTWREEEQPTRLKNPQAMPARPRHDESLPSADDGLFGRTVAIDGSEKTSLQHTENFIAVGMAFPMVGMYGLVVGEVDSPQKAVDRSIAERGRRPWKRRGPPIGTIGNQAVLQAEGAVSHSVRPFSADIRFAASVDIIRAIAHICYSHSERRTWRAGRLRLPGNTPLKRDHGRRSTPLLKRQLAFWSGRVSTEPAPIASPKWRARALGRSPHISPAKRPPLPPRSL